MLTYNMTQLCRVLLLPVFAGRYLHFTGLTADLTETSCSVAHPLKKNDHAHKRQSIPISKFVTGLSPKSSLVFCMSFFVSTYGSDRSDDRIDGMACSLRMSDDAAAASSRCKTTRKSSSNSNVRNLSLQATHLSQTMIRWEGKESEVARNSLNIRQSVLTVHKMSKVMDILYRGSV
jgi:hypothetical protein